MFCFSDVYCADVTENTSFNQHFWMNLNSSCRHFKWNLMLDLQVWWSAAGGGGSYSGGGGCSSGGGMYGGSSSQDLEDS